MNAIEVSKMFPAGTVIAAYKGKILGGAKVMPQWEIKPLIDESQYFRSPDEILAELRLENSISLEFEVVDPQHLDESGNLDSAHDFDDSPGELTFVPLDPENKVAHYFPLVKLKEKSESGEKRCVRWKFEILCDDNSVFMQKIKANNY
ncbi:MAG: hypothetical protein KAS17_00930 [Victivallaceae bacterium]|nr:hypothetical protein [Victivallaceae bacterium]